MAQLVLVRHGQASFGQDNYDQLSDTGFKQAQWLGEYFAERGVQFDRVVIGTQLRHRQTADFIARGMGIEINPELHAGLNEYDFQTLFKCLGPDHEAVRSYQSDDRKAFFRGLKQVLKLWIADELKGPLPEKWVDFYQRVKDGMAHATREGARQVLVVSSGGPVGTVAGISMKAPAELGLELNLQVRNTSFCEYFFNSKSLQLASFNCIPHLDRPDRLSSITYG